MLAVLAVSALAVLAALLAGCGEDGSEPPADGSGVSTRTPAPAATSTPTAAPRATTGTPAPARTPGAPPTAEPDDIARTLAELGTGEDARAVAGALALVEPRCEEPREELGDLVERGWRLLNERRGTAVPVSALLTRMYLAFPPGTARFSCDGIIAAVITELSP